MTYKIKRVIHPEFQGKKLEAEVELTIDKDNVYVGDNPIPDEKTSITELKVLWITDERGNIIWHKGNGKPSWGSISPELGLVINGECERIEDLRPEGD